MNLHPVSGLLGPSSNGLNHLIEFNLPKIKFTNNLGPYQIKIAETPEEFKGILRIRSQYQRQWDSFGQDPWSSVFDLEADHLIIRKSGGEDGEVIGTLPVYQLAPHYFWPVEMEFFLPPQFKMQGKTLEYRFPLVAQGERAPLVYSALWSGLLSYARIYQPEWMLGVLEAEYGHTGNLEPLRDYMDTRMARNLPKAVPLSFVPENFNWNPGGEQNDSLDLHPFTLFALDRKSRVASAPYWDQKSSLVKYLVLTQTA